MVLSIELNLLAITFDRFISYDFNLAKRYFDLFVFFLFGYFGEKGPVNEPELPLLYFFALQNWFARNL